MEYSGEIPPIVLTYLECQKRQLGLLQGMVTENPVGTCSKN